MNDFISYTNELPFFSKEEQLSGFCTMIELELSMFLLPAEYMLDMSTPLGDIDNTSFCICSNYGIVLLSLLKNFINYTNILLTYGLLPFRSLCSYQQFQNQLKYGTF